ncbi:MAG TPA: mechanosensitive ion channel domain-containing protein, partial [Spirochaetota bacterium]|nr:mechanosensitive ion channel domain-containing protein [Spirochaetota bacterium]
GLGAFAAVLLLVFKDTIVSIASGLQIQMNDMVRLNDWIQMPGYGIDGEIKDLALHTVKVQNWDKTIYTVPTAKLVNEAVINWRGMLEAGGRRMKRSILIDQDSITFVSYKYLNKMKKVAILKPYLDKKLNDIKKHNKKIRSFVTINGRALTNIGLFRMYITYYLEQHPRIHKKMTHMVRQLAPEAEKGLPLEVYAFIKDTSWVKYEQVQSDIFDHLLAVLPVFELNTFQRTSSNSLKAK